MGVFLLATLSALCLLSTEVQGVDILDVTTIYDVREVFKNEDPLFHILKTGKYELFNYSIPGMVHRRTNALGLNLFLNEEKYDSKTKDHELTCDIGSSCEWNFNGWSEGFVTSLGMRVKRGKVYSLSSPISLRFRKNFSVENENHEMYIVLTPDNKTISEQISYYVVKMIPDDVSITRFWYQCTEKPNRYIGTILDRGGIRDVDVKCHNFVDYGWLINPNSTVTFKYATNMMEIYLDGRNDALMHRPDNGNGMNFMSVHWRNPISLKPVISSPILESVENGSSIDSKPYVPSSNRLCLALVVYCSNETTMNVLQLFARDKYENEHLLYNINSFKAGWQVKHLKVEGLNRIPTPFKLSFKKVNPMELQISRISAYNCFGSVIDILPPYTVNTTSSEIKNRMPVYTAMSEAIGPVEQVKDIPNTCLNGGAMTSSGCACRPGFSGLQCQTGCGRNKFGQDCAGRCSFRSRECEGFLLCSQFTGCQCAPGYTGNSCTTHCQNGTYGNDCEQLCGNCMEGDVCNKYSGKCKGCAIGYLPPYCKQEYVYYFREPELVSEKYETITVTFNLQEGVKGYGEPKLYQVQYREKKSKEWTTHVSKTYPEDLEELNTPLEKGLIKETIAGLRSGVLYEVRVLLLDAGYNKYNGPLVKPSTLLTRCDIPDNFDYSLQGVSNRTAFEFTWTYVLGNTHWCPVEIYEVSWRENNIWKTDITEEPIYILSDFLPGYEIDFKVRAKTSKGFAPYSNTASISSQYYGTGPVEELRMLSSKSTVVDIAWRPPIGSEERQIKYKVTYKCVDQVACSPGCKDAREGQLFQEGTSLTLSALLPFTQYLISVTPEDGLESQLYVGTAEVAPTEIAELSSQTPERGNTSVTVYWSPVPVCSSYLQGYMYQLTKASDTKNILASGFTEESSVSFHNLTATTEYTVKVFINTVAGWNPDVFLPINISTSATVPEAVRNLAVYKRGRGMFGLRWTEPKNMYGELKSFTVKFSLGKDVTSETVEPTPCAAWPQLYCHTLNNLRGNKNYTLTVSARNTAIAEEGAAASVVAVTKESAPSPPEALKVLNSTSTSVALQWKHPDLVNGVLRSFLVNVEESEKLDQDTCCQDYPLVEIPVREETQFYEVEVSGLHPASTYYVSVSAKTVSMGLSQALVVHTRPPHVPFSILPPLDDTYKYPGLKQGTFEWLSQQHISEVNKSDIFSPLIKAHILLVAVNVSQPKDGDVLPAKSGIENEQLETLLGQSISIPFYFTTEYNEEGLVDDSTLGKAPPNVPIISGASYRWVAVQISDYNDVYNIDLRYSSPL